VNFEEARTLIDELRRENRITNNEYNILRDCIDEAENKIETLLPLVKIETLLPLVKIETLLPLVKYHIDELEDVAKNARRALRGMF
jgi:5-bromo-4-chloroindolyl phosphate hydrolysis protein